MMINGNFPLCIHENGKIYEMTLLYYILSDFLCKMDCHFCTLVFPAKIPLKVDLVKRKKFNGIICIITPNVMIFPNSSHDINNEYQNIDIISIFNRVIIYLLIIKKAFYFPHFQRN
jgi:hypothetical protein